ncbi:MAG TPA: glutamate--tRNA ligase [Candidatus Obscuribacterales bacterium]
MSQQVRVRIAPSPTGHLHLGTARTALYNYLYAKRHSGDFILRLEDTDEERSREEYTADIISGLKWLGLDWDEGPDIGGPCAPYRQTQKVDHYNHVANQLIAKGLAYFSYETPEELAALKEGQKTEGQGPRYDNRGRHLTQEQIDKYIAEGRVPSIRFKIEDTRVISWHDQIKGEISIDAADLGGDMVIVKSSGIAVYNFAVVVDDIDMKITHVIRGEDHIHNTAKQILLYEALGHEAPHFAHAALIFDTERRKLSKRHHGEAVHIDRYREDGYMPEAMVNYFAQMSWTHPEEKEIFTLEEAAALFDLNRVSKSPAIFDLQKLNWFNGHYIRSLPLETIKERAKPYLETFDLSGYSAGEIEQIVACVRDSLTVLSEISTAAKFFFEAKVEIPFDLRQSVLSAESAQKVLSATLKHLAEMPFGNHAGCKAVVDKLGQELGLKGKELYWPLRAALSGKVQGPDLGSIISILGERRVRARLEAALPCRTV